jgi:hypothetical protein
VSILISELRRITLLWDELWLGTLLQYSGEVVFSCFAKLVFIFVFREIFICLEKSCTEFYFFCA